MDRHILTIQNTYSHNQLYRHILVTSFGYLFAIIRPKTCGSEITRNHINTKMCYHSSKFFNSSYQLLGRVLLTHVISWPNSQFSLRTLKDLQIRCLKGYEQMNQSQAVINLRDLRLSLRFDKLCSVCCFTKIAKQTKTHPGL